ncbi:rhodanese-like domain-containing protein [Aquimarina sp. BL5]|uniref:rhodanese-like domain-containing protein n=1 Tax=Aquimarina sp. BL5 TaxID=1714860 RepID=UPI000E53299E|nr:rhodanese-like domain-containing protein [Aquimarina sp. BL5]AXT53209.1 rhodanese-like domain-containing protein [Aquimarina sp. BL5]RKN02869.1 rhodanese-like domain-containing protein [Aquimarina sp. BL5]
MKSKTILTVIFLSILLFNCKDNNTKDIAVELITVEEMDSLLEMEKVQLVDVRTPQEYAEGHIEGAINIDFSDENFETLISEVDKSKPVAVYCGRGGRSGKCSAYMQKAGFTKIYDLDGGITEWKYKGKTLVK